MNSATISSRFQILLPLRAGQKLIFITVGNTIHLVPQLSIEDIRGIASKANTVHVRGRTDRFQ